MYLWWYTDKIPPFANYILICWLFRMLTEFLPSSSWHNFFRAARQQKHLLYCAMDSNGKCHSGSALIAQFIIDKWTAAEEKLCTIRLFVRFCHETKWPHITHVIDSAKGPHFVARYDRVSVIGDLPTHRRLYATCTLVDKKANIKIVSGQQNLSCL